MRSENEKKVYLFIGPQRSLTTSLYKSLQKIKNISLMEEKENNYWKQANANFDNYKIFSGNPGCSFGVDICPQYFSDEETLTRIAREQDRFYKIIFLHRNPFKRAKSFLELQVAYGRDIGQSINDPKFLLHFLCHTNLQLCLTIFRSDKFEIVDVTNLEAFIAQEFNIPKFNLAHVHKRFGISRSKKFNENILPLILRVLRRHLRLNRVVDRLKESKFVRTLLFHQGPDASSKEIEAIISRFKDDLVKESRIVEEYFSSRNISQGH